MNYNKVILFGRLTRDPELRETGTGTAVTDFGLAVTRVWKNQTGEQQEETLFVDIVAWGAQAKVIHGSVRKGHRLHIDGRLKQEKWTNSEGQPRQRIRVHMENFQFIEPKGAAGSVDGNAANDDEADVPF